MFSETVLACALWDGELAPFCGILSTGGLHLTIHK